MNGSALSGNGLREDRMTDKAFFALPTSDLDCQETEALAYYKPANAEAYVDAKGAKWILQYGIRGVAYRKQLA